MEWKNTLVWSLEAGGPDEPGVLWAGTLPGGLFKSRDRGASWVLVRALWDAPQRAEWFGGGYDVPGIHSICVDPRNSAHVLVGVSCDGTSLLMASTTGAVWLSQDAGAHWKTILSKMPPVYAVSFA